MEKLAFERLVIDSISPERQVVIERKKRKALAKVLKGLDQGFHEALIRGTDHCRTCGSLEVIDGRQFCKSCEEKIDAAFEAVEKGIDRGVILNVATNRSLWDALRCKAPDEVSNLNLTSAIIALVIEDEKIYEKVILSALEIQSRQKRAGKNAAYEEAALKLACEL